MANSSTTVLSNPAEDGLSSSQFLSSSISSLSSAKSARNGPSEISKTYRQASALFLTRRMTEALSTLEPVLALSTTSEDQQADQADTSPAPIAAASRSSRIKVWSLYLTLLDAIVNLGPEEGRNTFGSQKWRELVSKARDGKVWEDVVRHGYGGNEGHVDADVVINLATLLLNHSPSQTVNQQRLENYLSASSNPTLEISDRLAVGVSGRDSYSERTPDSQRGGTNTPRDLNARIKILELYTLHVLPRNQEWDYAREFIRLSEVLDEERREAFLHTLHTLQDEKNDDVLKEEELERAKTEQLEREREEVKAQEARRRQQQSAATGQEPNRAPAHKRASSETDYGIEPHSKDSFRSQGQRQSPHSKQTPPSGTRLSPRSQPSKAAKKSVAPVPIYRRASIMMASLNQMVASVAQSMRSNPLLLLRTVIFLLGFLFAVSRRDVRDRIRRGASNSWNKVKGTVGMGVKVSYI